MFSDLIVPRMALRHCLTWLSVHIAFRSIERVSWSFELPQTNEYSTTSGISGKQLLKTSTAPQPGSPCGLIFGAPGTRLGAGALFNCTVTGISTVACAGIMPTLVTSGVTRKLGSSGT